MEYSRKPCNDVPWFWISQNRRYVARYCQCVRISSSVSNRESGLGRYDVCLVPKNTNDIGIVMEFKSLRINSKRSLEEGLEMAISQVNKNLYDTELKSHGVKNIIKLALAFKGKEVLIKKC